MSDLPISSPYRSRPGDPVGEDERNRVAARLNSAFTDGSLPSEDYRSRLDQLFAAETLGQLVPVVEGLPPAPTYDQPAIVAQSLTAGSEQTSPGDLTPARNGTRAAVIAVGSVAAAVLLIVILLVLLL